MPSPRLTYCSVTVFLKHGDQFLFLQRPHNNKVDSGRVNGVGGKVEAGENYLAAAIRETQEETGYQIPEEEMRFCGLARIEGGYQEDWVVAFFAAEVNSPEPPHGHQTLDGELFWAQPSQVLDHSYELVDDIYIVLPIIAENNTHFFLAAQMDEHEKVAQYTLSLTPL